MCLFAALTELFAFYKVFYSFTLSIDNVTMLCYYIIVTLLRAQEDSMEQDLISKKELLDKYSISVRSTIPLEKKRTNS